MTPFAPVPLVVDEATKDWIDARASWLLYQLGSERVMSASIVLPTAEYIPGRWSGSEEDVSLLLERICKTIQVDSHNLELVFYDDTRHPQSGIPELESYEREGHEHRIWVGASQIHQPAEVMAILAYSVTAAFLVGEERLAEDALDLVPTIELATVFLGCGVVTANAALRASNWDAAGWSNWRMARSSYLTMPMYGYGLALFSLARHEQKPDWARQLRPDVRDAFKRSVKYLEWNGTPELRSLRTTTALPAGALTDENAEVSELVDVPDDNCHYCGGQLSPHELETGVCGDCHGSIEENQLELEAERVRAERVTHWLHVGFLSTVVLVIATFVLIALGEWLGWL